jgi:hypothetical protein
VDPQLVGRRIERRKWGLDGVDAPSAAGDQISEAGGQRAGGTVHEAGDARRDRDAADTGEDRAEERRAPDRQALARNLARTLGELIVHATHGTPPTANGERNSR